MEKLSQKILTNVYLHPLLVYSDKRCHLTDDSSAYTYKPCTHPPAVYNGWPDDTGRALPTASSALCLRASAWTWPHAVACPRLYRGNEHLRVK